MPYVNVKIVKEQILPEQKIRVVEGLTDLIEGIMKRDRNMTVITIDEVCEDQWAIGGKLINQIPAGGVLTFINIKVSKGTTNPEEVREMMAAAKELMIEIFGNSHECNYFIIDELNPDCWGFDGVSMSDRRNMNNK